MDQEIYEEAILNGDTAFKNDNYEVALQWYKKAALEKPDDLYAISRAGTVCVPLQKFDESLEFFKKAIEIDPENGDNLFNLGNAYFFQGDYNKALETYAEAELKGCSEAATPRLYYQMALICSLREDVQAALVNFKKYEETDKTKMASTNPEVVAEKLKLYMMAEDFDNAIKCAAQWVAIAPAQLQAYMVYFSILMARQNYDEAEKILSDAERYANIGDDERLNVNIEKAALLIVRAETAPDSVTADDYFAKAYSLLNELRKNAPADKHFDIELTFAEACVKMKKYEEAIKAAEALLPKDDSVLKTEIKISEDTSFLEPDDYELEAMAEEDMNVLDDKIAVGEISEEIGEYAEIYYDDNGNPVREYPEGTFDEISDSTADYKEEPETAQPETNDGSIPKDLRERLYFLLLSCYATTENYEKAYLFGGYMKHSDNPYYAYFGRYTQAFSFKKLSETTAKISKDDVDKKYAEDIAFYRTKMLQDKDNNFAVVFRARMYAEIGKFVKAEEMASLLSADEKDSLMKYINQCRKEFETM